MKAVEKLIELKDVLSDQLAKRAGIRTCQDVSAGEARVLVPQVAAIR